MSEDSEDDDAVTAVEQALRRQASNADNRRDLSRLPQFKVDHGLPRGLAQLLEQMERVERRSL